VTENASGERFGKFAAPTVFIWRHDDRVYLVDHPGEPADRKPSTARTELALPTGQDFAPL